MRLRAPAAAALALAALVAGCGGDSEGSPIPAGKAADLQRQLDSVSGRISNGSAGACLDVIQDNPSGDNLTTVNDIIDSLPGRVDKDVRDALQRSFDHLFDLVSQRCDQLQQTKTTPPETTQTQTVETVPPETTPTNTQPQTTPTTPTTPETTPTVPDQGNNGNGIGNGNGNGNNGGGGAGAPGQGQ